jgi:hypothetical protein
MLPVTEWVAKIMKRCFIMHSNGREESGGGRETKREREIEIERVRLLHVTDSTSNI